MRGAPAVATAALTVMTLAGGGPAAAAAHQGPAKAWHAAPAAGTISTLAGGVGGPAKATRVSLGLPCGVAFGAGRLYVTGVAEVRAVDPGTDRLTTPVGSDALGPTGIGGKAADASLRTCGAAVDHSGNLVIADGGLLEGRPPVNRILVAAASTGTFYGQAMKAGHIYSVAGSGPPGFSGDGGPATGAKLYDPARVAVDAAGNLVIADIFNNRIRVTAEKTGTFYGQAMTAGDIYTVAGGGSSFANGVPATSAAVSSPQDVAADAAGNLVIADDNLIRVVAAHTGTSYGQAMTAGDIYTVAGNGHTGFSGDGGPATSAKFRGPESAAVDAAGNVLLADRFNNRIRVVAEKDGTFYGVPMTAGDIYTVAGGGTRGLGDGGPATSARVKLPLDATVDGAGNLVIANDEVHRVRVVAGSTGTFYGRAMTAGDIYTVAGNGEADFSGTTGPATRAQFEPTAVTSDAAGDLLIDESADQQVQMVPARTGTFYGLRMTAGHIYTVAGNGSCTFTGAGDGGPAAKAELCYPDSVAVDAAGNVLIADTSDARIRVVAATTGSFYGQAMTAGNIYTIAGDGSFGFSGDGGPATSAELNLPVSVAVDAAGNLLITDLDNQRIRVVAEETGTVYGQAMTAGNIYTIAGDGARGFAGDGGAATKAEFSNPSDATADAAGNVLIADHNRIRVVAEETGTVYGQAMTAGNIYTIAGNGATRFSGDGGPAISAALKFTSGVAVDSAGNVVIGDTGHSRIRVVAESAGSYYGVPMTAGNIYTVAGGGTRGPGNGGPATKAELGSPGGAAVNGAGNLLIPDFGDGRIWMITG
jgi:hypothetical protein